MVCSECGGTGEVILGESPAWCPACNNPNAREHKAMADMHVRTDTRVSVKPMKLSDDRTDFYVSIMFGDREVTPYVFRDEQYKAEYEAAVFRWLIFDGPKPDLMAYWPDRWPGKES